MRNGVAALTVGAAVSSALVLGAAVPATASIDTTAPVTTVEVDPPPNDSGWIARASTQTVLVTLRAHDAGGSGLRWISWTVDGFGTSPSFWPDENGNGPTEGMREIELSDGVHVIEYWAEDTAGNREAARQLTVRVDSGAPSFDIAMDSVARGEGDWSRSPWTFAGVECVEDRYGVMRGEVSGCAGTARVVVDDPPRALQPGDEVAGEGRHVVVVEQADVAGNLGRQTLNAHIDHTAPAVELQPLPPLAFGSFQATVTAADPTLADGTDGSEVSRVLVHAFSATGGGSRFATRQPDGTWRADFDLGSGHYEVRAVATDHAGNEAISAARMVTVLRIP